MSAFTPVQRQRATALYRSLLRTTRALFAEDQRAIAAAYNETRRKFLEARAETNPEKIDEGLTTGEQIVALFRHNVVQGVAEEDPHKFHLRFTKDTELGSNDTIRRSRRAPSPEEIQQTYAGRRAPCASMHTLARPTQVRTYATRAPGVDLPLPRPVAKFPQRVILADGSSIQLTTTSPRHLARLTRDFTNNPLWNPMMGHRAELDTEDDTGRLGRFRRRFAEEQAVAFDENDLAWMSGGREAREGTPIVTKKAKGKGRK